MSSRSEDEVGVALGTLLMVGMLITAWLVSKALELVVRAWRIAPRNRLLWCATGIALGVAVLVGLTAGQVPVVNALAGVAGGTLLLVCKALDLYYDPLLQPALSRDTVIQGVLHEPWYQVA